METKLVPAAGQAALVESRGTLLSPPEWQRQRQRWLGTVNLNGRPYKYTSAGVPELSQNERELLDKRIANLTAIVTPGPQSIRLKAQILAEMFVALGGGQTTERSAEVRAKAYLYAIEDMPEWAIEQAIKNWYKGAVRGVPENDFKWPPAPAILLRAAKELLEPYYTAIEDCRECLAAKPLDETIGDIA